MTSEPLPSNTSDTPKTNAAEIGRELGAPSGFVPVDFARAQEREIQRLQTEADKYRWLISQPVNAVAEPIQKMWFTVGIEGRPYPTPEEWDAAIEASMGMS